MLEGQTVRLFDLSAFDFNGDGIREIVTSARAGWVGGLSILDGASGVHLHEIILRRSAPDPTIRVADIDGDRHAEVRVKIRDPHWATTGSVIGLENAADDWMPTRPIWNQEAYHVTKVLADGTIPASEAVHWLQPGLNLAHVNALLLGEAATDSFTYEVSDGELASNEATVFVEMPENRPPRILSTPPAVVGAGFAYNYQVQAYDPDSGESLTYALGATGRPG